MGLFPGEEAVLAVKRADVKMQTCNLSQKINALLKGVGAGAPKTLQGARK